VLSSEYPTVDGKFSTEIYLKAVRECFLKLKEKNKGKNPVD
jgi:3-hydroxy-3-methylglutaryl CoA synthase